MIIHEGIDDVENNMIDLTKIDETHLYLDIDELCLGKPTEDLFAELKGEIDSLETDIFAYGDNLKSAVSDIKLLKQYKDIMTGVITKIDSQLYESLVIFEDNELLTKDKLIDSYVRTKVQLDNNTLHVYTVRTEEDIEQIIHDASAEEDLTITSEAIIDGYYYRLSLHLGDEPLESLSQLEDAIYQADYLETLGEKEFIHPETLKISNYVAYKEGI